jgi:hypothetical protein
MKCFISQKNEFVRYTTDVYIRGGFRKLEKNMIFWRKIVIFHTKYPKNVRASLRNWKKYNSSLSL